MSWSHIDDLTGEETRLTTSLYPWLEMHTPNMPDDWQPVRFIDPYTFTCPQCHTERRINRHQDTVYGSVTYCRACRSLWMLTGCLSTRTYVYRAMPKTPYIAAFAEFCRRKWFTAVVALPAPSEITS